MTHSIEWSYSATRITPEDICEAIAARTPAGDWDAISARLSDLRSEVFCEKHGAWEPEDTDCSGAVDRFRLTDTRPSTPLGTMRPLPTVPLIPTRERARALRALRTPREATGGHRARQEGLTTMATKKVTAKDGADAIAMLDRERNAPKEKGPTIRRCTGSERFGIEAHDAPVSAFPVQPSRKDGLGTMCAEHWKAYVKALTADRKANALVTDSGETVPLPADVAARVDRAIAREARRTARAPKPVDPEVVAAEALVAEVDALPGPEHIRRVGDPDVQAALEAAGTCRSPGSDAGETMDAA